MIALEEAAECRYRKLVFGPDGTLAGAILFGYSREAAGIVEAIETRRDLSRNLDDLREGNWSVFVESQLLSSSAATRPHA